MNRPTPAATEFEQSTRRYIKANALLHSGAPVIVALSGGADSVALLAVLTACGYECIAAHCNFQLRGAESNRDMLLAREVAARLGAEFCLRRFDMATEAAPGESTEMACRRVRYEWFGALADRCGAQAVAVGHHREDRAETFILNLMRGAGIVGLTSMNPRNADVVRPLLWASRAGIEDYLRSRGLDFVQDSTNSSDAYSRNRVRLNILPLLEHDFPGAMDALLRSVANLEKVREVFLCYTEEVRTQCMDSHGRYDLRALQRYPNPATLLLELLRGKGFTPTQIDDMLRAASGSGSRFIGRANIVAELDRGLLTLREASGCGTIRPDQYPVSLRTDITTPLRIRLSSHPVENFRPEGRSADVAYVDAGFALAPDAVWTVRHWQRGDRMVPFGAHKSKLVSDIFAAARLGAEAKRTVWLLLRNDQIIWIPGVRTSALGTVGPDTRRYLRLEYLPQPTTS